jgi:RNA polymerase sigma factor (sigma-70 family)
MSNGMQQELERAFKESFEAYADAIFRFCLVKVSQVPQAEDLTQETFMRYWQSLRNGKEMTNTRSFLYTIANNLVKDWYKKKKSVSLDEKMEESGFEPEGHDLTAEELTAYREALESMEDLPPADREVLLLTYVEGFDPKDIGDILGETANVVSVRLNRATKRLREKLHVYETA